MCLRRGPIGSCWKGRGPYRRTPHRESKRSPRVLSVFSGAGGLDLGLESAGFKSVGCVELDEFARRTLALNRPNWTALVPNDVVDFALGVEPADLGIRRGELELLAGGPPCQPFSKAAQWHAGARAGLKDPRSACFESFIELVRKLRPKIVLIENVQGFTEGSVSALPLLRRRLGSVNRSAGTAYKVQARVVDACDFGVPQHRRRSIIVARRDGSSFLWPSPTHADQPVRAWDAIGDMHPRNPPAALGHWAALLPSVPEGSNYLYHTPEGDGEDLFGYRTRYWSFLLKLAKDRPAWTLPAQPPQNAGPFHWDNRRLTWKEMLRLQSFPRGWKVAGDYNARVRQIGNATPPLLAEIIGREIRRQVLGHTFRGAPRLSIARRRTVPSPAALASVPESYLAAKPDLRPHPGIGMGPGRNPNWHSGSPATRLPAVADADPETRSDRSPSVMPGFIL